MRPPSGTRFSHFAKPALWAGFVVLGCLAVRGADAPNPAPPASGTVAIPDPAAEGWDSEAFADQAQAALKSLLQPLTEGNLPPLAETERLAARLSPPKRRIFDSLTCDVWRSTGPDAAAAKPLPEALGPVISGFQTGAHLHLKVKTVGVEKNVTTHLVHLDGPGATGRRESNATWVVRWKIGPEKALTAKSIDAVKEEIVETAAKAPWFADRTAALLPVDSDVAAQFSGGNPYWRLRLQGCLPFFKFGHHGVSIADVNGDGLDDVYVCQPGGLPNRLLIHQPDHSVRDEAAGWGVDILDSTQCVLLADLDNDGDPDLVVAANGPVTFYENTGNRFESRFRLPKVTNVYGLTAADYDLDGDLDVYAVRYYPGVDEGGELAVPMPHFDANNGGPNFLIRNDGLTDPTRSQGWRTFSDATAEVGLDENNRRFSYAAVWDDFNNDGLPDLYVANDFGRNNLYLQKKGADGRPRFADSTGAAGLLEGAFGMSAATGDFDRDGWPDIHLGAMFSSAGSRITAQEQFRPDLPEALRARFRRLARGNTLFANGGAKNGPFRDVSETAGITVGRWSWASLFADIDNDAWPDLLVANGFMTGEIPDDL